MRLARASLLLAALPLAVFGLWFLLAPAEAASLVEIALPSALGRIDIRAMYGGLSLALTALLVAGCHSEHAARPALFLQIASYAGLAAGRLFGMIAESAAPGPLSTILAIELILALLGVAALRALTLKTKLAASTPQSSDT